MSKVTLFFALTLLAAATTASAIVGKYKPIPDIHDPHVKEVAKFAVTEHNKQKSTSLEYVQVIKGEEQIVAGTNYRLLISAKDASGVENYVAVVYNKQWAHYMSLTSFTSVTN